MSRVFVAAFMSTLLLAGCMSYGVQQVAEMSNYDLCALRAEQRANLTPESQRLVQSEIDRRKLVECASYASAIEARRAEELYDRTYRNQSP